MKSKFCKSYKGKDLSPEFVDMCKDLYKKLRRQLGEGYVVLFNACFYDFYTFVYNKETGKWCYVSCPDVRHFKDWKENILVRKCKDDKDFSGGGNNFCKFDDLHKRIAKLTA